MPASRRGSGQNIAIARRRLLGVMPSPLSRAEGLDLHKLRVFAVVAEYQNFSRAAEVLHISQPAVSVHVKDLERYLGVPLFERVGRGAQLTEAGQLVDSYARRLLAVACELEEAVEEYKGLGTGQLRIGASTTPGAYLLPVILSSFRQRYPGICITVEIANTSIIAERIRHGRLHLGLLGEPVRNPELQLESWIEDELLLVLPAGHRWSGREIDLQELSHEALIRREEGSATDEVIQRLLAAEGISPGSSLVLGDTEAVKRAVASGLGIAFVSARTIADEVAEGRLAQCRAGGLAIKRTFQLARRRGGRLSAAEEAFITVARQSVT